MMGSDIGKRVIDHHPTKASDLHARVVGDGQMEVRTEGDECVTAEVILLDLGHVFLRRVAGRVHEENPLRNVLDDLRVIEGGISREDVFFRFKNSR